MATLSVVSGAYSLSTLIALARHPSPAVPLINKRAEKVRKVAVEVERIVATKVLIARYQHAVAAKGKAIAAKGPLPLNPKDFTPLEELIPPELEDFIRALGHQIFASGDPSANLRAILGEGLKSGRRRKGDRDMAIATAVFELHYGCREVALEDGRVVKRLGPKTGAWPGPRIARSTYEEVGHKYTTAEGDTVSLSADQVQDIYLRLRGAVTMNAALAGHLGPLNSEIASDGEK